MDKKEIIKKFYNAWINKDIDELKNIYSKEVVFNDPAFKNLDYNKTIKMWKMIFGNNKNPTINSGYKIINSKNNTIKVLNTIKYSFKGNDIVNPITSTFILKDNKIIKHTDVFDFNKWIDQALDNKKQKSKLYYSLIKKIIRNKMKRKLKKQK